MLFGGEDISEWGCRVGCDLLETSRVVANGEWEGAGEGYAENRIESVAPQIIIYAIIDKNMHRYLLVIAS